MTIDPAATSDPMRSEASRSREERRAPLVVIPLVRPQYDPRGMAGRERSDPEPFRSDEMKGGTTAPEGRRRLRDAKRTVGSLPEGPLGGLYTPPHTSRCIQIRPIQ